MRFATTAIIAAATASTSYASLDSCSPGDYGTWMVSYMQGFQADPTSVDTDCYASVEQFTAKLDIIGSSLSGFSVDDWAAPIYALSDSSVAASDTFVACQTTNFAKQMSTRFSTLAGLFDLSSTIGVAFLKHYTNRDSPLYDALMEVDTMTTCADTANSFGQFMHYAFNYEVPEENFADELGQDLVSEVFE